MNLKEFLSLEKICIFGDENVEVEGVSYDSRSVGKNYAFFALSGHFTDGKKYIQEALDKGASLIITDTKQENISITQIVVEDVFKFMSDFCAKFYDYPDRKLKIIGITGTNGKTSITYMIESILAYAGIKCGVIGTINYRYNNKVIEATNTTPQSADIYKIMKEMVDEGIKYLVMEVSSHALVLGRVRGIEFDMAVFTNLTQDHLDFHKNIDEYFAAKSILFKELGNGVKTSEKYSILNVDDKYGKKLAKINNNVKVKLYGAQSKTEADFKAENIKIELDGSSFEIVVDGEKEKIKIGHIGLHNIYNALAAFAASICCGISTKTALEGINQAIQAPGRLERVDSKGLGFEVVVDYAHTDDALKNVLLALKEINPKRIITVFGCGGDRDRSKRPIMGKTAVEMSDFAFVTSDNPRTEDANQIVLDVEVGIKRVGLENYKVIVDRETAIKEAILMADKDDIVLIAGKGHETYQILGTQKIHFDDREKASKYIEERYKKRQEQRSLGQTEFKF